MTAHTDQEVLADGCSALHLHVAHGTLGDVVHQFVLQQRRAVVEQRTTDLQTKPLEIKPQVYKQTTADKTTDQNHPR